MPQDRRYPMSRFFVSDHAVFWANLTRLNNLLVVLNISLFFLTGLLAQGYFYTFISLGCLGGGSMATIVPTPYIRQLWYYGICVLPEPVAHYFLVNNIVYWVRTGGALVLD